MKCILCQSIMYLLKTNSQMSYFCNDPICLNKGMPRYTVTTNEYFIEIVTLMIDKYYLKFDHISQTTQISKLDGCILNDTVKINKILDLDETCPQSIIPKLKNLMLFS